MAIPDFQTLMLPLLRLCADGQTHSLAESVDALGNEFNVSMEERQVLLKSGQTRLYNRVAWTSTYLRKAGLLDAMGPGKFRISELGQKLLNSGPPSLDVAYLAKEFPTVAQFLNGRRKAGETNSGSWTRRFLLVEYSATRLATHQLLT
jgi:restriction system protein